MVWNRIIGQERPLTLLRNALRTQRLAHAYLFAGPPNVGKTTVALALAQTLNCLDPVDETQGCGTCRSCRKIAHGNHPDVRVVNPGQMERSAVSTVASRASISIEQVREVEVDAHYRPLEGRRKVYIFESAEQMTVSAANALLKILEEPPRTVLFVLTSANPAALLSTIRSRCQEVPFGLVPAETIREALEQRRQVPPQRAQVLATLAAGRVGRAFALAAEERFVARREQVYALAEQVLSCPPVRALQAAEQILTWAEEEGKQENRALLVEEFLELLLVWFRDLLVWRETHSREMLINRDEAERVSRCAELGSSARWQQCVRAVQLARQQLQRQANAQLALEVLMLTLSGNWEKGLRTES